MSAAAAIGKKIEEVLRGLPWARSKENPKGKLYTSIPDDYFDHALPALVKAGHPMASHALNLMMRLSWGKKGTKGDAGSEWIPMPITELTALLGSNRNTTSINLRALVAAGVIEERKNAKDKRVSDYRVSVENLAKLNQNAFRDEYEKLIKASLKDSDPGEDDAEGGDDDTGAAVAEPIEQRAFAGPVVRFGSRSIPAFQVAQEAHLCKECTHHFVAYATTAGAAQSAPTVATQVENATVANKAVGEKQCTSNVHNYPSEPPSEAKVIGSIVPQLRIELGRRFAARLASAPPEQLLKQLALKLDTKTAYDLFLKRISLRSRAVTDWGLLLNLADDASGAAAACALEVDVLEFVPSPDGKGLIRNTSFQVDCDRFREEYPKEVGDWDIQILLSVVRSEQEQDLLFENLARYQMTEQWQRGVIPSAKNWLQEGKWKVAPKILPQGSSGKSSGLSRTLHWLAKGGLPQES